MTRDPLNIGVRLTPELHAALSAEVSRRTSADPDAGWTLSSVARSILRVALLGRAAVPLDGLPVATPSARAELQPVGAPANPSNPSTAPAEVSRGALESLNSQQRATTGDNAEGLCEVCGEGLWHHCTRKCGRRTRTCVCAESIALDGVCASCAQSPAPSMPVDLVLAPPKAPKPRGPRKLIAPDEVQDAARAEVLQWLGAHSNVTRSSLGAVAETDPANVLRWLAPGVRQRLPAAGIDLILAHIRANP